MVTRPVRRVAVEDLDADDGASIAGRAPAWLVARAVELVAGVRERDAQDAVDALTGDLSWSEIRALLVVTAALCPGDVKPAVALEWLEVPPAEWSTTTVVREAGRWDEGARDYTAARGRGQWHARRADDALSGTGVA